MAKIVTEGDCINGPLTMLVDQDEWIDCNHPEQLPARVSLGRPRLPDNEPYLFLVRLKPALGRDLAEFGAEVSRASKLPPTGFKPQGGDAAAFLSGGAWAQNAAGALAGIIKMLTDGPMGDIGVSALAARVWMAVA